MLWGREIIRTDTYIFKIESSGLIPHSGKEAPGRNVIALEFKNGKLSDVDDKDLEFYTQEARWRIRGEIAKQIQRIANGYVSTNQGLEWHDVETPNEGEPDERPEPDQMQGSVLTPGGIGSIAGGQTGPLPPDAVLPAVSKSEADRPGAGGPPGRERSILEYPDPGEPRAADVPEDPDLSNAAGT
jgi:hypothetical protein